MFMLVTLAARRAGEEPKAQAASPANTHRDSQARARPDTTTGARPSSGAASSAGESALEDFGALTQVDVAAPEDGRAPVPRLFVVAVSRRAGRASGERLEVFFMKARSIGCRYKILIRFSRFWPAGCVPGRPREAGGNLRLSSL